MANETLIAYEVLLSSAVGAPLQWIAGGGGTAINLSLSANQIGALSLQIDASAPANLSGLAAAPSPLSRNAIQLDGRVQIWRSVASGYAVMPGAPPMGRSSRQLVGGRTWLIRDVKDAYVSGKHVYNISAVSPLDLLRRRIVKYAAGSAQAKKSGYTDDLIKVVVRENLGTLAAAGRDISAYLAVDVDRSQGAAAIGMTFAYRNVLDVCKTIAGVSATNGIPLFFDVLSPTPDTMMFYTFPNRLGKDHGPAGADGPVVFSLAYGNLENPSLDDNHLTEYNSVTAGGKGEASGRLIATSTDTARAGASVLNLCETFVDARNADEQFEVQAEADADVRLGRPRTTFTGSIIDSDRARFGVDWNFGDTVTAEYLGAQYACNINQMSIAVQGGKERLSAKLEAVW